METKNKGGNSELDGKLWTCPDYVLNVLKSAVKTFNINYKNTKQPEGYKRAVGIINDNKIEYKQMKRIKNWFDSFEGKDTDIEYRLNGGSTMKNWVESNLKRATKSIEAPKKIKSETGLANQFIKTHEKDSTKINKHSLKIKLPNLTKDISGQISRGKPVYEELERIKLLIIYESKI
jgi:hypothetical protein